MTDNDRAKETFGDAIRHHFTSFVEQIPTVNPDYDYPMISDEGFLLWEVFDYVEFPKELYAHKDLQTLYFIIYKDKLQVEFSYSLVVSPAYCWYADSERDELKVNFISLDDDEIDLDDIRLTPNVYVYSLLKNVFNERLKAYVEQIKELHRLIEEAFFAVYPNYEELAELDNDEFYELEEKVSLGEELNDYIDSSKEFDKYRKTN